MVCLLWSIRFNFHYLPFRQAIRLPVLFEVIPTFLCMKGVVRIENENIRPGISVLGKPLLRFTNGKLSGGKIWEPSL